jgi:hypothetical protein
MANITGRQKIVLDENFLEGTGAEDFTDKVNSTIAAFLSVIGDKFTDNWRNILDKKDIIATGGIDKVRFEIDESDANSVTLNIFFPYYATFVDKGVKGVKSSANAPDSPYQFKNYGMNSQGRASVKRWLDSGKAKVTATDVKRYGSVGGERKFSKISEADSKLNTLIYNIKKYGIKKRDFINPVLNETLDGASKELSDILGKEIVINIFQ